MINYTGFWPNTPPYCIVVPPSFGKHSYADKLILKAGSHTAIEIPYTGAPQPEVTWAFKGGSLPDPRRCKEETVRCITTLILTKVQLSDTGDYTLTLENIHGKTTFKIKVIVLGKWLFW